MQTSCGPAGVTFVDNSGDNQSPIAIPIRYTAPACAWCSVRPSDGEKLKRCAGCNIMFYCGKECQKAAWPTHKASCRKSGETRDIVGYATIVGLMQAVDKWCDLHKYALTALAHAVIRRTGGVEANLRLGRMIVFAVSSRRANSESAPADGNPAKAFKLYKVDVQDGDHVPQMRKLISESLEGRSVRGGFRGDSSDTKSPAGFMPVLCIVAGTVNPAMFQFPVYRPSRHPDDAVDEETNVSLQEISRIFTTLVDNGTVIRPPADGRTGPPCAGVMVRMRKDWTWQQDQRAWQDMMSHQRIPSHTSGSATDLWTWFQQW